ncbi:unnamed protein product [Clonostachys rhizophaga]|uniref:MFS general substrate transporter n=1 Tax=Clonostachys rhizophaga TaxID=160324 RepID=A0A9N9VGQ2_9HYPO|nr:unnamed protein product [Clonostachys rhizophaga]
MLVVGMWYTHPEQVLCSSFRYSFSGGWLVISPLVNYGLGHISGAGLHPWQHIYLIAGASTFLWGIALWWLFPETPQQAPGFDEYERSLLLERIKANNAGSENHNFKVHYVRKAFSNYQFWGLILLSITTCTGGGVVNTFSSIVLNGMGFTNFQSLLLNLSNGGMAFLCILGSGYIVGGWWNLSVSVRAGRIIGFYLINCFSSGWVQCIGLGISNVAGNTKKSVYAAGTFVGYSVGNIVGPLVFDAKYAPRYKESFIGIMVCFRVSFFITLCLRAALARENTKRQSKYGDPELSDGLEDLTDRENMSFRYNL